MQKMIHFLKYHNGVPLVLGIIFLGSGAALAANPEARESVAGAIISKEVTVRTVDNSFIVNTDIDSFAPSAQITDVTEDDENYYITYTLRTIGLKDNVWEAVYYSKELAVSKALLGTTDLGIYVAEEIKEVTDRQLSYLKETQIKERKNGETEKVVATAYSGLVGKFLDPKEEVIIGYEPILGTSETNTGKDSAEAQIAEQIALQTQTAASAAIQEQNNQNAIIVSGDMQVGTQSGAIMVMLGNNPSKVPTNASGGGYSDNGVRAQDNKQQNLSVSVAVDGVAAQEVSINTKTPGAHTVRYTSADHNGNILRLERAVIVYDRYKTKEPAIVILGDAIANITAGNTYADKGALAIDYDDGNITQNINIENTVDTTTAGTYKVRYSVTDSNGNTATAARIVTVTPEL